MSHAPGPAAASHQVGKSADQLQQHVYTAKWWQSPLQSSTLEREFPLQLALMRNIPESESLYHTKPLHMF